MVPLNKLLSEIISESIKKNLSEQETILFEESELFQELADPNCAYDYKEVESNVWEFNDRFGNTLGVSFNPTLKYFESFYKINNVKIFDLNKSPYKLLQGGSDEHRSDTICKILKNEVIPKYLKSGGYIRLYTLDHYRFKIFWKCAEVCKASDDNIEIKPVGNEIYLIRK